MWEIFNLKTAVIYFVPIGRIRIKIRPIAPARCFHLCVSGRIRIFVIHTEEERVQRLEGKSQVIHTWYDRFWRFRHITVIIAVFVAGYSSGSGSGSDGDGGGGETHKEVENKKRIQFDNSDNLTIS